MGDRLRRSEPENIQALTAKLRELIRTSRQFVVRSVNTVQVLTNFEIGRHIVEFEQQGKRRAEYGRNLLKKLSNDLTAEFGKGFSEANLKLMRQFYLLYHDRISQTLSDKLPVKQKNQTLSDLLRKAAGLLTTPLYLPSVGPTMSS